MRSVVCSAADLPMELTRRSATGACFRPARRSSRSAASGGGIADGRPASSNQIVRPSREQPADWDRLGVSHAVCFGVLHLPQISIVSTPLHSSRLRFTPVLFGLPMSVAMLTNDFIEPPSFQSRSPLDPHSLPIVQAKHAFTHTMRVTYPTVESASIAFHSVSVDDEIRPDRIYRHMRIDDNVLVCYFSAIELKSLRVAISAFLEMLALATETMAQFTLSEHK